MEFVFSVGFFTIIEGLFFFFNQKGLISKIIKVHAIQDHLAKFAKLSGTHDVILQMEIELLHLECLLHSDSK